MALVPVMQEPIDLSTSLLAGFRLRASVKTLTVRVYVDGDQFGVVCRPAQEIAIPSTVGIREIQFEMIFVSGCCFGSKLYVALP